MAVCAARKKHANIQSWNDQLALLWCQTADTCTIPDSYAGSQRSQAPLRWWYRAQLRNSFGNDRYTWHSFLRWRENQESRPTAPELGRRLDYETGDDGIWRHFVGDRRFVPTRTELERNRRIWGSKQKGFMKTLNQIWGKWLEWTREPRVTEPVHKLPKTSGNTAASHSSWSSKIEIKSRNLGHVVVQEETQQQNATDRGMNADWHLLKTQQWPLRVADYQRPWFCCWEFVPVEFLATIQLHRLCCLSSVVSETFWFASLPNNNLSSILFFIFLRYWRFQLYFTEIKCEVGSGMSRNVSWKNKWRANPDGHYWEGQAQIAAAVGPDHVVTLQGFPQVFYRVLHVFHIHVIDGKNFIPWEHTCVARVNKSTDQLINAIIRSFTLGTNVNTPFCRGPTPEFAHCVRARVQGRDLYSDTKSGCLYLGYPVSEHSTILYRCPGTSARAPNVNMA